MCRPIRRGDGFCVPRPGHPGVLADSGLVAICLDVAEEGHYAQCAFRQSQADWHAVESHNRGRPVAPDAHEPGLAGDGAACGAEVGRNRMRLEATRRDGEHGEFLDAGGNEFHVTRRSHRTRQGRL